MNIRWVKRTLYAFGTGGLEQSSERRILQTLGEDGKWCDVPSVTEFGYKDEKGKSQVFIGNIKQWNKFKAELPKFKRAKVAEQVNKSEIKPAPVQFNGEKVVSDFSSRIVSALKSYELTKNCEQTRLEIKNKVLSILQDACSREEILCGTLPTVDINNSEELKFFQDKRDMLVAEKLVDDIPYEEVCTINDNISRLDTRIEEIKYKISEINPTEVQISFKHPVTFEELTFEKLVRKSI